MIFPLAKMVDPRPKVFGASSPAARLLWPAFRKPSGRSHFTSPVMVPPLAFAMYATKIKEALLVDDPFEVQERLFHQWWAELEGEEAE